MCKNTSFDIQEFNIQEYQSKRRNQFNALEEILLLKKEISRTNSSAMIEIERQLSYLQFECDHTIGFLEWYMEVLVNDPDTGNYYQIDESKQHYTCVSCMNTISEKPVNVLDITYAFQNKEELEEAILIIGKLAEEKNVGDEEHMKNVICEALLTHIAPPCNQQ